ncbi:hypothetical protein CPB86DRAFT_421246 [Serendipita vermifera]|nr:hypothetical protein CPB86DRAFT_421246 [Serendipita vermifera]
MVGKVRECRSRLVIRHFHLGFRPIQQTIAGVMAAAEKRNSGTSFHLGSNIHGPKRRFLGVEVLKLGTAYGTTSKNAAFVLSKDLPDSVRLKLRIPPKTIATGSDQDEDTVASRAQTPSISARSEESSYHEGEDVVEGSTQPVGFHGALNESSADEDDETNASSDDESPEESEDWLKYIVGPGPLQSQASPTPRFIPSRPNWDPNPPHIKMGCWWNQEEESQSDVESSHAANAATEPIESTVPIGDPESDEDYEPNSSFFDKENDDDWPNISSDVEEDSISTQTTAFPLSGVSLQSTTRHRKTLEPPDSKAPINQSITNYFARAWTLYGIGSQSLTQWKPSQEGSISVTQDRPPQDTTGDWTYKPPSQQFDKEKRYQLVRAVAELYSHWFRIPLPKVREVWETLPKQKRTFKELQKVCLESDLSDYTPEHDDSKPPGWSNAHWKRQSEIIRRMGSSNTEESSISSSKPVSTDLSGVKVDILGWYDNGRNVQWPSERQGESDQETSTLSKDEEESSLGAYRQKYLWAGNATTRFPYPNPPDREWVRVICRLLAAIYGWRRPSVVHEIWKENDSDATTVESIVKQRTRKSGARIELWAWDEEEIPRPWL